MSDEGKGLKTEVEVILTHFCANKSILCVVNNIINFLLAEAFTEVKFNPDDMQII